MWKILQDALPLGAALGTPRYSLSESLLPSSLGSYGVFGYLARNALIFKNIDLCPADIVSWLSQDKAVVCVIGQGSSAEPFVASPLMAEGEALLQARSLHFTKICIRSDN
ncbi:hypothetical protein F2Q70_00017990 [Brassica cretica]|uniref:Uncharacterized protein n=1 Tax=Brassica cretica TaxID=69181 RepID=A0A8S9HXY8_BRACR|nr:hypothetical protein F2Q70_00017990 [Brassica cretica]